MRNYDVILKFTRLYFQYSYKTLQAEVIYNEVVGIEADVL